MTPKRPEFVGRTEKPSFRGPGGIPLPGKFTVVATSLLVLVALVVVFFNLCFEYVHPNEFGIKVVKIGLDQGVQEEWYGPGYAFRIPFNVHQVHRLPQSVQVLEMTNYGGVAGEGIHAERGAKIQTSDGFFVDVDATILYRIVDPYKVFTTLGPGTLYRDLGILPKAESVLKEALGQLTTEEFYDSEKRVAKADLARDILNDKLDDEGIVVEHVLVRYFEYSDSIQQNIEDKKLQDQLVFTNESKGRAADQREMLTRTTAEGDYLVKVKLAEGEAYRVEKEADSDKYRRTKMAEADLLVARAEAKGVELKNQAMQAVGAEAMVAMQMTELLKGLDTILLPAGGEQGMNPLDLNAILTMFGLPAEGSTPTPVPVPLAAPVAAEITTGEVTP